MLDGCKNNDFVLGSYYKVHHLIVKWFQMQFERIQNGRFLDYAKVVLVNGNRIRYEWFLEGMSSN